MGYLWSHSQQVVFWFSVHSASDPDVTVCEFGMVTKVIKKTEALCHPLLLSGPVFICSHFLVYSLSLFSLSPPLHRLLPYAGGLSTWCPSSAPCLIPTPLSIPPSFISPLSHTTFHLHGALKSGGTLNPHGYSVVVLLHSSAATHRAPILMPRTVVWQLVSGDAMCFSRDAFLNHSIQRRSHPSFAKSLHSTLFSFFKALITMWN